MARIASIKSHCLQSLKRLHKLENRMAHRVQAKDAKLYMLQIQWDVNLQKFEQIAKKNKAKQLVDCVGKLKTIREDVRYYVLNKFA